LLHAVSSVILFAVKTMHIDDFYYTAAEVLCTLYAAFPVRHLLLVDDITGPVKWDMTGLPDRRSKACFETLIWLAEHGLLNFRTVEPRDVGIEGAVLTQRAFVLLTAPVVWVGGDSSTRIQAIIDARRTRAYEDLGMVIKDLLHANCRWGAPADSPPLKKSAAVSVSEEPGAATG
jgi:hypothetical protein